MKKKMITIIICMLMVFAVLPTASSTIKNNNPTQDKSENSDNECGCMDKNHRSIFPDCPIMDNPPDISELDGISTRPILVNTPSEFNWRDYNGADWTTPVRNQGRCGSCWAFAALGVFESMIKIREDLPDFNPDLSEQYVLSCLSSAGSCRGGNTYDALELIKATSSPGNNHNGIIPESCFEYQADDDIPCSAKCPDWEEKLIPLLKYGAIDTGGTENGREAIKTQVMQTGPVAAFMKVTDLFKIFVGFNHNPNAYFPKLYPVFGLNHVVIIVGWKDNPLIRGGGYWICKNSWGPEYGYDGFFNIAYGSLNIDRFAVIWADYDPDSFNWPPIADSDGSYGAYPLQEITFDGSGSYGLEGDIVEYFWDFGDGTNSTGVTTTHSYSHIGKYTVTLTVTDSKNTKATDATNVWIQDSNNPPGKPFIDGQTPGRVGEEYTYTLKSIDPEDNDVWFIIDWGDGTYSDGVGPYASGEEAIISNTWDEKGTYTITVRAVDVFGAEGPEGTLPVTMPKTSGFFSGFIDNLPLMFRILKLLFNKF